jgi:uncharacterized phiE125 gp8 family phage protein
VAPTFEPLDVPTLKEWLRIETADEDALLLTLIGAARSYVEEYLWRQLCLATFELALDAWPVAAATVRTPLGACLRLPRPPCVAVTQVQYYDTDGALQTLAATNYHVDTRSEPARLVLAEHATWPTLQGARPGGIVITYTAGWTTPGAIPLGIRQAIAMLCGDLHEHREAQLDVPVGVSAIQANPTVTRLLAPYRFLEV